ncbi:MAG: hypothetical protein U9Q20_06895 [Campylobacterota bacterium]|nr:hypothetical protein [Campylobacterota bacterium]
MKFKLITSIFGILLLSGCTSSINTAMGKSGEPKWLKDPYIDNDKLAAVGCANTHIDGEQAQKKLAIARAIDQIATSKEVKVQNVKLMKKSISGIHKSSSLDSSSLHSIDNVSVSTKTKATYKKSDGEICAWVILK